MSESPSDDGTKFEEALAMLEARPRLAFIGSALVERFIGRLRPRVFETALSSLPKLDGYNRGTDGEKRRQRSNLFAAVTTERQLPSKERYWRTYLFLWSSIGSDQFGDAWSLQLSEDVLNNDGEALTLAGSLTSRAGQEVGASREALTEIMALSPLKLSDEVLALIKSAPLRQALERQNLIAQTPKRLDEVDQHLTSLESQLVQVQTAVDAAQASVDQRIGELREELQSSRAVVETSSDATKWATLTKRLDDVSSAVDGLHDIGRRSTEQGRQIAALSTTINALAEQLRDATGAAASKHVKKLIDSLSLEVGELSKKVDENRAGLSATTADSSGRDRSSTVDNNQAGPGYRIHQIQGTQQTVPESLSDWTVTKSKLAALLVSRGSSNRGAERISLQVVAALRVGQMPIFAGSIADGLALLIAQHLCGPVVQIATMQVGSFEPLCVFDSSAKYQSIVLSGLSRSPFEAIGGDVRLALVNAQMGWTECISVPVFGTFEAGPAALPLSTQLLEVGPLIDLEPIRWKEPSTVPDPVSFELSAELLASRGIETLDDQNFLQRIDEDCAALEIRSGSAWRLAANRYLRSLFVCMPPENNANNGDDVLGEDLQEAFDSAYLMPLLASSEPDSGQRLTRWEKCRGSGVRQATIAQALLLSGTFKTW